ncbi:MAG: hypothetical protein IIA59_13065 [Candidatus Marinimicrobia bacterium]|nr:hypothetical protein [Candidatus Neomarinimicrobiota bacterium]
MKRRRFLRVSVLSTVAAAALPRILLKAAPISHTNMPPVAAQDPMMPLFATGDQLAGGGLENFNDASFTEIIEDIRLHHMPIDWSGSRDLTDSEGGDSS